MAEKIVSPGVFTKEVDQSFLPAGIQAIGAAVVGPTVKGPALVPTVVSSYSEYKQIFGDTFTSGSGTSESSYAYMTSYAAKEYLKNADTLTVVRILAGGYAPASTIVSSSTTTGDASAKGAIALGQVGGADGVDPLRNPGSSLDDGNEVQITVDGTEYRFIASDPAGGIPADASPIYHFSTGSSVAEGLNFLTASINNASIGVTAATGSGFAVLALTASAAGTAGNSISVDTGSGASMVDVLDLSGGTDSTTANDCFSLTTLADGEIMNSTSPLGTNQVLASGSKDNFRWEVTGRNTSKGTFNLQLRRGDDLVTRKTIIEQFNNVTLDPNTTNYIGRVIGDQVLTLRDSGTTQPFLQLSGSYPNKSRYVRVTVHQQTYNYLDSNGNVRDNSITGSLPNVSSGSFAGGNDGTVAHPRKFYNEVENTNTQGFNLASGNAARTAYEDAISVLKNQDEYDINLLMLPGLVDNFANHSAIISDAVQMCEDRGDCFTIVDPVSYGSTLTQATTQAEGRDSNYAAMYWPWVQVPDNDLGRNVWVPPSVLLPGVYAFNDRVAAEWFAPAGLNRGGIDMAVQAERKLTHTNRDTLYESNVNPLATFPNQGVCVWGQKTLQKKASALDRVNVRRLLIAAKKFIASSTRFLVFEQNTAATRLRFLNIVNPYLESVQQRQGLYAFKVVMDETNNTPDVIDRNQMVGQLFLQPTKTAEFIIIDFNILPTGAAFPE